MLSLHGPVIIRTRSWLSGALLILALVATATSARAATQIPLEMRDLSAQDKVRSQERAHKLQKEQAAAALAADRRQKAARRGMITGVNARSRQRAAEITQQLKSDRLLLGPAKRSGTPLAVGIASLVAGFSLFRWLHGRGWWGR